MNTMPETLPSALSPILYAALSPLPGSCWGGGEQARDAQFLGVGSGVCPVSGLASPTWTGVLTGPSHNPPRHNPHPHTPVLCISQKPPLSCSAKNPGLAESCGGPLECRFPVPAPVCQPRQRPRGRMGDHRILSGMGRLAAMSHRGGLVGLPHLGWGTPHTGAALNCWPVLSPYHPSRSGGAGSLATVPLHHTPPSSCPHTQYL